MTAEEFLVYIGEGGYRGKGKSRTNHALTHYRLYLQGYGQESRYQLIRLASIYRRQSEGLSTGAKDRDAGKPCVSVPELDPLLDAKNGGS